MKTLLENAGKCSGCGLCQADCPIFRQTREEGDGPRGKLAILRALARGLLKKEDAVWRLSRCMLCGACARACPAGIPLSGIFLEARQRLGFPLKMPAAFFRAPGRLADGMQAPLAMFQKILKKSGARSVRGLRNLPQIAPRPFRLPKEDKKETKKESVKRVLLFPGCASRRFMPGLAAACARALEMEGYEVVSPAGLVCCGWPLAARGDARGAASLAVRNLAILAREEFGIITTPCPACAEAGKSLWPWLESLGHKEREAARRLAPFFKNIMSLLSPLESGSGEKKAVFWHRPCMAPEENDDAARALFANAGLKIAAHSEKGMCCGAPLRPFGFPEAERAAPWGESREKPARNSAALRALGDAAGLGLRDEIAASAAGEVLAACPGCILRLRQILDSKGDAVRPRHPVEIYVELREAPKGKGRP